jgi:hypothetical protein
MTAHRYTSVHDTAGGLWHVLPTDPAHEAMDILTRIGWEEHQIVLPVRIYITGQFDPAETSEYYKSVVNAASEAARDKPSMAKDFDPTLITQWNTYNQLRYLEEHYEPQINQPV